MDQIEEVRSKIDIVQLISEYLPLQKSGRNFKALCPFHSEKAPSFMVSPERQIFKCFGCGAGGDVFGFLMRMERMEFGEALRTLAKRAGVVLTSYRPTTDEAEKEKFYKINHLTSEFYHYLLISHPVGQKALSYLLNRGIKKESIELFKLGFAPALWEGLQKFLVGKRGYRDEDLLKLGLIVKQTSGFRDFFRDRIIFPLKDNRGNVVGFAGRVIGVWQEEQAAKIGPKYINTPESPLYHKSDLLYGLETTKNAIKSKNEAVVVEGELDLISSYQAGVENVVAIKGSALTETQCRLLKRFCENLILALDTDIAGDQAARRGIKTADSYGLAVKVAKIPEGKDPDELARKNPQLLRKTISEAIGVYDFLIESAFGRYNTQEAEGKKKIGQEILPVLAEIGNEIVKDYYIHLLANRLEVTGESILRQMAKVEVPVGETPRAVPGAEKPATKLRREILEEYLFALLFQDSQPESLLAPEVKRLVSVPALRRIVEHLEKYFAGKTKKFTSEKFAKSLPNELLEIFNNFYLVDLDKQISDKAWFGREKEKTFNNLEEIDLREKIKNLSAEIKKLEKEGKETNEAKRRFSLLCRRLGRLASLPTKRYNESND